MPSDAVSVVVFKLLDIKLLYKTRQREGATIADGGGIRLQNRGFEARL